MIIPRDALTSVGFLVLLGGCSWFGGQTPPEWVLSPQHIYSSELYLTGIGESDSRDQAEKRAYAAIARIFTAQVKAQSLDHESYSVQKSGETSRTQQALQIDHRTQVTTNKLLENVKILEVWFQKSNGHFFALAGLDRRHAEQTLLERLSDLDAGVESMLHQGRSHPQKIQRIHGYKQALGLLADREALNTDLRVVRKSGEGLPASHRMPEIQREFLDFVAGELVISVAIEGEHHEDIERAILEGLKQEGLAGGTSQSTNEEARGAADLEIIGQGKLWVLDLPDPLFKYVRWCGDIDVYELPSRRLVGVISETGREGHVTEQEAKVRATSAMQQVLSREVAHLLTQSIFDKPIETFDSRRKPKACPQ